MALQHGLLYGLQRGVWPYIMTDIMAYGPAAWHMALQHGVWAYIMAYTMAIQHGLWPYCMAPQHGLQHGLQHVLWPYSVVYGATVWRMALHHGL